MDDLEGQEEAGNLLKINRGAFLERATKAIYNHFEGQEGIKVSESEARSIATKVLRAIPSV